jgi:hypothetical protein
MSHLALNLKSLNAELEKSSKLEPSETKPGEMISVTVYINYSQ